jgi:hypothetical protein
MQNEVGEERLEAGRIYGHRRLIAIDKAEIAEELYLENRQHGG